MKWQDVQEAQAAVAERVETLQIAVNLAHDDAKVALSEFRERLSYDLDLAVGTHQLLRVISQHTSERGQCAEYTPQVWTYREELEPLAQAYGFTIVESDVTKNIGSAVPA